MNATCRGEACLALVLPRRMEGEASLARTVI